MFYSYIDYKTMNMFVVIIQDGIDNENADGNLKDVSRVEVPLAVDQLIGKEFLFKVAIETKHIEKKDYVYVVEKFSADKDMIKIHKKIKHSVVALAGSPSIDIVDESKSNEEQEVGSPDDNFKTPEMSKSGKRRLDSSFQDSIESATSKSSKSE